MMLRTALAIAAITIGVTAASAQQEAVKARKGVMGAIAKPWYGVLARIQRGQSPYDQTAVNAALMALAAESQKVATAFAPNVMPTAQSDYDASPKIWQNKADFDAKAKSFVKAVADNSNTPRDVDTLKVAFSNINKTCDACHETYRVKNR